MAVSVSGNELYWKSRIDNSQLKRDSKKTQGIMSGLGKSISSLGIFAGVGIAAAGAIKHIIKVNTTFEKSVSVLSSITGAVGDDLDFYKKKAIEMGSSTTQSATQVVDAFKLIGSQRPSLLKDKEALAQITSEAITLSEAAQIDVPAAAKALTTSLNQMGASSEKSTEYINILAAASKEGAGDIPYLNAAIEKSGKIAADSNLGFAELVEGIELLAPAISEPSSAGLHFKNVLLQLQKAGLGYTTGIFDLKEALQSANTELDAIADPAERAKKEMDLFGKISLTSGKILLENADNFGTFADKITGTNTAFEQAKTNTDNLDGAVKSFHSAVEGLILGLNDESGLTGSLKAVVEIGTLIVQNTDKLTDVYKELFSEVGGLFTVFYDLAESLGLVSDEGDAVSSIMEILATTTKITMLPLKGLIWAVTKIVEGITFLIDKIKVYVKESGIIEKVTSKITKSFEFFKGIIEKIQRAFEVASGVIRNIRRVFNEFIDDFGKSDAVVGGINAITDAFNFLKTQFDKVINFINEQFEIFKNTIFILVGYLQDLSTAIYDFIVNSVLVKSVIKGFTELKTIVSDLIDKIVIFSESDVSNLAASLKTVERQAKQATAEIVVLDEKTDNLTKDKDKGNGLKSTIDIERLKIEAMKEGLEKRLALINYEYDQRKEKFESAGIDSVNSEIQRNEQLLQARIDFNNELFGIETNSKEELNNKQFEEQQAYDLSMFELLVTTEQQRKNFEITQEIESLQRQKKYNKDLTELEKNTIDNKIKLQKKLLTSTQDSGGLMIDVYEAVGSSIQSTSSDSEASLKSYANAAIDAAKKAIAAWISEAVIKMTADGMGKAGFPAGLIIGPAAGAAALAIMNTIIPKFEQGGVVPGSSYSGDRVPAMVNSGELILNQKQAANVLFQISQSRNNGFSDKKMNSLLSLMSEQNYILNNARSAVVMNNQLLIIGKNGKPTGDRISY